MPEGSAPQFTHVCIRLIPMNEKSHGLEPVSDAGALLDVQSYPDQSGLRTIPAI